MGMERFPESALLVDLEGESIRQQWLLSKQVVRIGRQTDNDIVVDDRWTSRYHAEIRREGDRYLICDLDSKNGTLLNGVRIAGVSTLTDGDQISVAPHHLLTFVDYAATAPLPERSPDELVMERASRALWVGGKKLDPPLSQTQFELLSLLLEEAGRALSREEVIRRLWPGEDPSGFSDDALNALVHRLRTRLRELAPEDEYIVAIRGFGFRLDLPSQ